MKIPAYPRYKPSGVEWLGDVPEHWEVKRLKFAARTIMGQSPSSELYTDDPDERPFLQGNAEFGERFPSAKWFCDAAPKRVPSGALLLSVRAPVGALNEADKPYAIGRGLCAVVDNSTGIEKDYAWYALQLTRIELHTKATGSTYDAVSAADVGNVQLALPDPAEQQAIAAFLDRETGRVDRLVAKKRELIERLKEKRTALISRTVTRGLPPAAALAADFPEHPPLKPSGLDRLGDIPNNWKVCTLRRACSDIFLGLTSTVDYVDDGGFPLVRALNIAGGKLDFSEARYISEEQHRQLTKYRRAKRDDVLLSKSGSIGTCALVDTDRPFSIYESIFALRAHPSLLHPKYLLHLLRSDVCQAQYLASLVGMGVGHLNMSDITEVLITLPPLPEQAAIAAYLDEGTAKLDALVGKVQEAVERLQEYRTALITAAVTGKIDVRKEVAQ